MKHRPYHLIRMAVSRPDSAQHLLLTAIQAADEQEFNKEFDRDFEPYLNQIELYSFYYPARIAGAAISSAEPEDHSGIAQSGLGS